MHTNLATYLGDQINIRSLDKYFEIERSLIFNKYISSKVFKSFDFFFLTNNRKKMSFSPV